MADAARADRSNVRMDVIKWCLLAAHKLNHAGARTTCARICISESAACAHSERIRSKVDPTRSAGGEVDGPGCASAGVLNGQSRCRIGVCILHLVDFNVVGAFLQDGGGITCGGP